MNRKLRNDIGTFITGFALLALVYMLVRPGMPAAQAINDISSALTAMTRAATGWSASDTGPVSGTKGYQSV